MRAERRQDDSDNDHVSNETTDTIDETDEDAVVGKSTILKWMKRLGYRWAKSSKHFYSDKHEHPLTVAYRTTFIHRYLFDYEPRTHRWIRLLTEEAMELRRLKQVPANSGTEFVDGDGAAHTEFHVKENKQFERPCNKNTKFGSYKSTLFVQARSDIVTEWLNSEMFEHDFCYSFRVEGESWTKIHTAHCHRE